MLEKNVSSSYNSGNCIACRNSFSILSEPITADERNSSSVVLSDDR